MFEGIDPLAILTFEVATEARRRRIDNPDLAGFGVSQLDETDRQLVKLKYFEDLKYRDISAQTGLSISNVGYRLHHILKELAGKLRPLGIDGRS